MGLDLSPSIEVRVWDTTADTRYMVLPVRPPETHGWSAERLAEIVTQESMIGTRPIGKHRDAPLKLIRSAEDTAWTVCAIWAASRASAPIKYEPDHQHHHEEWELRICGSKRRSITWTNTGTRSSAWTRATI